MICVGKFVFFACMWLISSTASSFAQPKEFADIRSVEADLIVPSMVELEPVAGQRVRRSLEGWNREKVYHSLYLPTDWTRKTTLPIIVEYSGNRGYRDALGDTSTGRPEDSCFGYGMSKGEGFV